MVASKLDLNNENAVEIGADYEISITLCGTDDLTEYQGVCNIKLTLESPVILLPTIQIINKDTFKIIIPFGGYPGNLNPGNYVYDVLFYKPDKRFYAVEGRIQILRRVSTVI